MLEVQKYLRSGKTLDDLTEELAIKQTHHPSLPLVILNYSQIDSPKVHPIVRECRGLVLEKTPEFSVVSRSFPRFFNWGEVQEEMKDFDFSDFVVQSKEDGSLALLYHYDGHWRVNTRGSFAQDKMEFQNFTWEEGVCKALGLNSLDEIDARLGGLLRCCTIVCEFCSPWNKVVRKYEKPTLYLLTAFGVDGETGVVYCDELAKRLGTPRPTLYQFKSLEEIQTFLQEQGTNDPTFEGVVIRDRHNHRWKIKSSCYLALHRLGSTKDCLFAPKNLLPFVLSGESDELLTYFGEVKEAYEQLEKKVCQFYEELESVWLAHKDIKDQKTFALAIKGKTPFVSLLFNMRKRGITDLRTEWSQSADAILKVLKTPSQN